MAKSQARASGPISPPEAMGPRDGALPAYVSNGLIGLRVREMPLMAGMALVSGLAGEHRERRIEAAADAPYPLAGDIAIDGVWLSDQPWAVSDLRQSYDFSCGELTSRFRFQAAGRAVDVLVLTFASRTAPAIVLQEIAVTADAACTVGIRAVVQTRGVRGRMKQRRTQTPGEKEPACDGSLLWETEGAFGECGVALFTDTASQPTERSVASWDLTGPLITEYAWAVSKGGSAHLRQVAALVPSAVHPRPDEEAVRRVARAQQTGFEVLRDRNRAAWSDIWRGRVLIRGASDQHQAMVDAAFFYLNSSVHPASPASTAIFGLATWHDYHYYFGHVMWDVDAFCVPPVILFQPDAARALLEFRFRTLSAARGTARLSGREGLQFPWESAPSSGHEAAPGSGSAAHHEDHVSLHVARGFAFYADISGDDAFLREQAWPVVSGVADWWVSRVTLTERGYELLRSMGPAEVPNPPDNDAFTLMAGADILRRAIRTARRLERQVPDTWENVLDGLYLPVRADGVIVSHDDFRVSEDKGQTPSPLAGLFPYDFPASEAQRQKTLEFFLSHWQGYVGAPMLPALYSTWACMSGDRDLALALFEEGYAAYDSPRFHQCLEYRADHPDSETAAGPFFANLGGMLLGLVYGLTGLKIDDGDPEAWPSRPVVLPTGWTAIEVERLWIRGRPAHLMARHGADRAELTWTDA